jgi:hypothetical protein
VAIRASGIARAPAASDSDRSWLEPKEKQERFRNNLYDRIEMNSAIKEAAAVAEMKDAILFKLEMSRLLQGKPCKCTRMCAHRKLAMCRERESNEDRINGSFNL